MKLNLQIAPIQWLLRGERKIAIATFEALSARLSGNKSRPSRILFKRNALVEKGIVSPIIQRQRRVSDFEAPRFLRQADARWKSLQAEWCATDREARETSDLLQRWAEFNLQATPSRKENPQVAGEVSWVEE